MNAASTVVARKGTQASGVKTYAFGATILSLAIVIILLTTLAGQGLPGLIEAGPTLLGTHWSPNTGAYGILPMLYGTFAVMLIAMALALPVGILAAIYVAETRSDRIRRVTRAGLESLAGIPSIIYGLIGVAYVSVWVADGLDLQTGRVILTAGVILAVMILPTILSLSTDAITNVPKAYRENAAALGLYRWETFRFAVWPSAKGEIVGAGLLALGRAMGETMAVMLVIGSLDRLPDPLWDILSSGQTLTSKLGREIGESAFGSTHFSVLVLMSLILVSFTLLLTAAAHVVFKVGKS